MEKISAARLLNFASLTGTISPEHFSFLHGLSANDYLMTLLTTALTHLRLLVACVPGPGLTKPLGPSILTIDIDEAFNCVVFRRLVQIMKLMKLSDYLSRSVASTGIDQFTSFDLDILVKPPQPINTDLS